MTDEMRETTFLFQRLSVTIQRFDAVAFAATFADHVPEMKEGKKKSHKGGHRHFTSEDDLAMEAEKARKQKEWRAKKGIG